MIINSTKPQSPFTSKIVENYLSTFRVRQLHSLLEEATKNDPINAEAELEKGVKYFLRKTSVGRPIGKPPIYAEISEAGEKIYFASFKYGYIRQSSYEEHGKMVYCQNSHNN